MKMDLISPRTLQIYVMKVLDVAIRIMETSNTHHYEPPLDYVIDIYDDIGDIRRENTSVLSYNNKTSFNM